VVLRESNIEIQLIHIDDFHNSTSGLEMSQNSSRIQWTSAEVDKKLKDIMAECYRLCFTTGKEYDESSGHPSLVIGANVAGFLKVAKAMIAQGDFY
jgi:glutamate dehydrogenase (NADP+)